MHDHGEPTPLPFRAADLLCSSSYDYLLRYLHWWFQQKSWAVRSCVCMIAIYFLLLYPLLLSFWFPGGFGLHFVLDHYYICFIFHENQLVVVVAITSCPEPKIAKRPKPDQVTGSKPHYSSTRRHLRRNGITRNSVAISATKKQREKASREQPR